MIVQYLYSVIGFLISMQNLFQRKKEGMKPWLQGRLALSKQTSRFELPMDVRVLECKS